MAVLPFSFVNLQFKNGSVVSMNYCAIIGSLLCDQNDNLESQHLCGWQVHATLNLWPEMAIVRIVKMGKLTLLI